MAVQHMGPWFERSYLRSPMSEWYTARERYKMVDAIDVITNRLCWLEIIFLFIFLALDENQCSEDVQLKIILHRYTGHKTRGWIEGQKWKHGRLRESRKNKNNMSHGKRIKKNMRRIAVTGVIVVYKVIISMERKLLQWYDIMAHHFWCNDSYK